MQAAEGLALELAVTNLGGVPASLSYVGAANGKPTLLVELGSGELVTWSVDDGQVLRRMRAEGDLVEQVRVHPDGQRAVLVTPNGVVEVWDLRAGIRLAAMELSGEWRACREPPRSMALLEGGRYALVSTVEGWEGPDCFQVLYDLDSYQHAGFLHMGPGPIEIVTAWPPGELLFEASTSREWLHARTTGEDSRVRWSVDKPHAFDRPDPYATREVEFGPDEALLTAFSSEGVFVAWRVDTGAEVHRLEVARGSARGWMFPRCRRLLVRNHQHRLEVWDLRRGERLGELGPAFAVLAVRGPSQDTVLVQAKRNGPIAAVDIASLEERWRHPGVPGQLLHAESVSQDGTKVACVLGDSLFVLNPLSGEPLRQSELAGLAPKAASWGHGTSASCLVVVGEVVPEAGSEGTRHWVLGHWDTRRQQDISLVASRPEVIALPTSSRDGEHFVSLARKDEALVLRRGGDGVESGRIPLPAGAERAELLGTCEEGAILSDHKTSWVVPLCDGRTPRAFDTRSQWSMLALSPSGALLGTVSERPEAWSIADGRSLALPEAAVAFYKQEAGLRCASAAVGLDALITGGADGSVCLWDDTGHAWTFRGHDGPVIDVASLYETMHLGGKVLLFSEQFASIGEDRTLRVWSREEGEDAKVHVHDAELTCCVLLPDRRVILGDAEGGLMVFRITELG